MVLALAIAAIVGAIAAQLLLPSLGAFSARIFFRENPEIRRSWAEARWVRFSRRFGAPYAVLLIVSGAAWLFVTDRFLPDTTLGGWLLLGPMMVAIAAGVVLGAMAVLRWAMTE